MSFPLLAIYVVGFIAVFYFLAIRPQQKQRRSHEEMVSSLRPGDEVMTVGGINGVIRGVDEQFMLVEVAKGVELKMTKRAVAEIVNPTPLDDEPVLIEDEPADFEEIESEEYADVEPEVEPDVEPEAEPEDASGTKRV